MMAWVYIVEGYIYLWELRDRRVDDFPLMNSPLPTLLLCLVYVMIVKVWGPTYMKDRPPYQLYWVLVAYNLVQVCMSAYLFYEGIRAGWFSTYSFRCQPIDFSDNPSAVRYASVCWLYFIVKFFEFFDTFFFVLRKKNGQISALHVIHHGLMPINSWFGVRFVPGGHGTFFGFLNSFVHIVMYFYYLVSGLGPKYAKMIVSWKIYITILQMVQFTIFLIHALQLLFIECDYPIVYTYLIMANSILFLTLFGNFFCKAYVKKELTVFVKSVNKIEKHQ